MNKEFNYYLDAFRNYAEFDGRVNREQFWYFILFSVVISVLIGLVSSKLSSLYSLVVLIPSLAIGARRLHDIGKSGWMQLVVLIPFVGIIWLIILLVQKSSTQDNQYGAAKKEGEAVNFGGNKENVVSDAVIEEVDKK